MSKTAIFDKTQLQGVSDMLNRVGKAIGQAGADDTTFRAMIDAFRSADRESFQRDS